MLNDLEIIVVSGLPRSGTSLMMQMLAAGGLQTLTDNQRVADVDNPHGYFELESVKRLKSDSTWLPEARGKSIKVVSQLLFELPHTERYRIIFMQRSLQEILQSQGAMLKRIGRGAQHDGSMKKTYDQHLVRVRRWIDDQPNISVLDVDYNALVAEPLKHAARVSEFLDGTPAPEKMASAVDKSLYRNRA